MTNHIFPNQGANDDAGGAAPHVYKVIRLVGSSETGIQDAIDTAIARASAKLRGIGWFEVVETRGHVEEGRIRHYQVTLNIGFTLDGGAA